MPSPNSPIGVLDTGVGGLTVVKEIQRLLPNENIVYIGDSMNCPYGNKCMDEINFLTSKMLDFLDSHNIKIVAIACNTISSALSKYNFGYDFKIKGIIHPAARYVKNNNIKNVGIFATAFTVNTGSYSDFLGDIAKDVKVVSRSSSQLASLIDSGDFSSKTVKNEIRTKIGEILKEAPQTRDIILACTHYPIIIEVFRECFPELNFINPAFEQAMSVKKFLMEQGSLRTEKNPQTRIFTTGNTDIVNIVCEKIGVNTMDSVRKITL